MAFFSFALIVLFSIGASRGLFYAYYIFRRRDKSKRIDSEVWLAALLTLISLECLRLVILRTSIYAYVDVLVFFTTSSFLALGPVLFLYSRHKTRVADLKVGYIILLFVPFLLELALNVRMLKDIVLSDLSGRLVLMGEWIRGEIGLYTHLAAACSHIIYTTLSFKQIPKITNEVERRWLRNILTVFGVSATYLLGVVLVDFWLSEYSLPTFYYRISTFIQVYLMFYIGTQNWFFKPINPPINDHKTQNGKQNAKIKHSMSLIDKHLKVNKIYLDANMTQAKLAEMLELSNRQLTEVLNRGFKMNFFDFVNSYRIDYFIEEYKKEKTSERTIIEIAQSAGFSSKATFNRAFKKRMGTSPSIYFENLNR